MSDSYTDQARLGDSDEPVKPPKEDERDEQRLTDSGDPQGPWRTKGEINRFTVSSALQKAVRRSDEELAAWAAWELARSGFHSNLWDRLNLYAVEDLAAGQKEVNQIGRYEELSNRWENDEWRRIVCAIHAALTAARARSSRESPNAHGYFKEVAKERAEAKTEGREPTEEFPVDGEIDIGGLYDVVLDRHSKKGKSNGRDWKHFYTRAVRVGPEGESELSRSWHRKRLQISYADELDDDLLDHAVSTVEPNARWEEDQIDLDELGDF